MVMMVTNNSNEDTSKLDFNDDVIFSMIELLGLLQRLSKSSISCCTSAKIILFISLTAESIIFSYLMIVIMMKLTMIVMISNVR